LPIFQKPSNFDECEHERSAPTSRRLIVLVQSPPLLREVGRNDEATFPRRPTIRSPQSSGIFIFSFSRLLTGCSWTATLFLFYDRTLPCSLPFSGLLLLVSGNVHPYPGPAPVRPTTPKFPCSACTRDVGRTSIQCSRCKRWAQFTCSGLSRPDLRSIFSEDDVGG